MTGKQNSPEIKRPPRSNGNHFQNNEVCYILDKNVHIHTVYPTGVSTVGCSNLR